MALRSGLADRAHEHELSLERQNLLFEAAIDNMSNGLSMYDADWKLVRSRHGSNDAAYVDPLFGIHLTGGSHSVKNSFTQYRELGARARAMLLSAAAARWKVDVASLRTQAGMVLGPDGRNLGYGELADFCAPLLIEVERSVELTAAP